MIVLFLLHCARDIKVRRDCLLGSGAAGIVYQGTYQGLDVAIKVI
jgi:predicted Ser/Thr protein kinase